ncbi:MULTISPECIES: hypothetical protein [unclassified Mesorhizobium]|uniref:hypothetical protein n=1 Tax=unclassified Mesorhizobium TaxID=325217 RepID=UPI001128B686|nr:MULTISPECIES: hypothetical protein [unclassified Mesorhizobium]MBZ9807145.1 hypothetical protein [Mesorhizobium sp. ESP-6-2]TPM22931.1 hypothetical protein FJ955_27850 [Mesorhizobium sp. B2-2-2]
MIDLRVRHLVNVDTAVRNGKTTPAFEFIYSHPCVLVGFFFDSRVSNGETKNVDLDRVWALIDTGADGVYVDQSLIEKYSCPIAQGGEAMTVNNEAGSKAHRGSIFIIETGRALDMWVIGRDLRGLGYPYHIILGRRFLQFCDLRWDGPNQMVHFAVGENPSAY